MHQAVTTCPTAKQLPELLGDTMSLLGRWGLPKSLRDVESDIRGGDAHRLKTLEEMDLLGAGQASNLPSGLLSFESCYELIEKILMLTAVRSHSGNSIQAS